jgi:hypothetical protein
MELKSCRVTVRDMEGVAHTVEVTEAVGFPHFSRAGAQTKTRALHNSESAATRKSSAHSFEECGTRKCKGLTRKGWPAAGQALAKLIALDETKLK